MSAGISAFYEACVQKQDGPGARVLSQTLWLISEGVWWSTSGQQRTQSWSVLYKSMVIYARYTVFHVNVFI
jgi:hypothetical protein